MGGDRPRKGSALQRHHDFPNLEYDTVAVRSLFVLMHAQEVAEYVAGMARRRGFDACACSLDDAPISRTFESSLAVFVVSTTGDGEVPNNMSIFWRFLLKRCDYS